MNAPADKQPAQALPQSIYWTLLMAWIAHLPREVKEGYAAKFCDTLQAYPKMFRAAPEEEPENVLCVVRVGSSSPPVYVFATWNGTAWQRTQAPSGAAEDHAIRDVTAWAVLPS